MKTKSLRRFFSLAALLLAARALSTEAAEDEMSIDKWAKGARLIPISLSGFTGEVAAALRFDLEIMGFTNVSPDQAQYIVTGSNNGQVEGRLTDRISKAALLARAYAGGAPRSQAHALADDIVLAITGKKGIARTKIAFRAELGSNISEIYIADYDGRNAVAVTKDHSNNVAPCWVPGRRKLYYTSYRMGNPDVYSHDLASGLRKAIAHYSGLNTSAAVSPDGNHVALILSKNGSPDLYVCDAEGGDLKQLTRTREDESSPCWSPDGRMICFVSRDGRPGLYTISADGGAMRRIRTAGVFTGTEPDWSPDGKTIVFTTQRGGASFEICTVPAEGGTVTALGVSGEDPSWAPNSRTVIFATRKRGNRVLSLLDVPTKQVKDIAPVTGSCSQPSWAK